MQDRSVRARRAVLLAAGLGTRLRPLTLSLPKPAVPFVGRPLAGWMLERLAAAGIEDVVANTHHLAEACERELAAACPSGMRLRFSREASILGTAGGIRAAASQFAGLDSDESIVVVNGDLVFAPPFEELLAMHARGALATLVLRRVDDPWTSGAVQRSEDGRIHQILGRDRVPDTQPFLFTGVHVLAGAVLERLPREGCIVRDVYLPWLRDREALRSVVSDAPWRDLGTLATYLDAHAEVLAGTLELPGIRAGDAWVDPTAELVRGAMLRGTCVGARARVGAVRLERCVVWPGAAANVDATDCVFMPDGSIVPRS